MIREKVMQPSPGGPTEDVPAEGWVQRHRGHIMVGLCCLALSGTIVFMSRFLSTSSSPVLHIATAQPTSRPTPTAAPAPLRVYVSGAVAHPDVYVLPPDALVKDAISAAGGSLDHADLDRVNLADGVSDHQHVHVPQIGQTPPPQQAPLSPSSQPCVNINVASAEELDTLPGIGPAYARRIIEYRLANGPFQDIEDLTQIQGIGPATLEGIRSLVCLE
jgi:competence protein ComEA